MYYINFEIGLEFDQQARLFDRLAFEVPKENRIVGTEDAVNTKTFTRVSFLTEKIILMLMC